MVPTPREQQLGQLERDLAQLGHELGRITELARRPPGPDQVVVPGSAFLVGELANEHARLRGKLDRLRTAGDEHWDEHRLDLERGGTRLRLVLHRLGARLTRT